MRLRLRTQLTLLYAVPFFVSGTILLAIPLFGVKQTQPADGSGVAGTPVQVGIDTHRVLFASAIGLVALSVVSIALGWFIAGRFLRPLRTITATARDISATNLHRRLALTGRSDEFRDLADTLDDLFARLENAFEAQRRFVANASHELRTPLTAERTLLQVALADPDADVDSLRATCRELLGLGRQQERLIEALLTLATSEQGIERPEPVELAEVARTVLAARQPGDVTVTRALGPAPVSGDPDLLESLVANLVDNALRYNVAGGRVEVTTTVADGRAGIGVRNTGPVVPPDQVARLFQPFQRLDRQRTGERHGLGLAIVRAIAAAHGAALTARAQPGGGLDIWVTFP